MMSTRLRLPPGCQPDQCARTSVLEDQPTTRQAPDHWPFNSRTGCPARPGPGDRLVDLGPDQASAVVEVATSGRELDVLVGPAGSGKTTALAVLREVWGAQHGEGSVIGLAPSASAAHVLSEALSIPTDNTAKWLTETATNTQRTERARELNRPARLLDQRGMSSAADRLRLNATMLREQVDRWSLRPGQLLIIDEASLAGTLALDKIIDEAREQHAKVLLVGDGAQISAVDAGGAFGLLARDRASVPELTGVRRFTTAWERDASRGLRHGDPSVVETYQHGGRISEGDRTDMLDAAYAAWRTDESAERRSLLIAADKRHRHRAQRASTG